MTFQSFDYLLFLPIVLVGYWLLPRRGQNALLLVASYFFYGYVHPWFLLLIATSTLVDYGSALGMERWPEHRRRFLHFSLLSNLGLLGFFKYYGFFVSNVAAAFSELGLPSFESNLDIFLPVGISFYTFQTLSYSIDVYRGVIPARRSLLDVAVYVAFFPQLVAGPIERATRFLPQIEQRRIFHPGIARAGILLIVWGFFKKLVIADNVGVMVNKVFALPDPGFWLLWTGVLGFCIQIFADFSAYTDIARGTARLFGFELMNNFEHPYLAQNPNQFWRRWHISLSTWIRDYIYIPLGGSRTSRWRSATNLMIAFFLCGLWHGASWNFVLWGVYHGALVLIYRAAEAAMPRVMSAQWGVLPRWMIFFALTNVGWLIFRESDFAQLLTLLSLTPSHTTGPQTQVAVYFASWIAVYSIPLIAHACFDALPRNAEPRRQSRRQSGSQSRRQSQIHGWLQDLCAAACLVGIWVLHSQDTADFIYFQF